MHFNTVLLKESKCPACNYKLNAATGSVEGEVPGPGDVSICINCTATIEYTDDMDLRLLTEKEYNELPREMIDELELIKMFIRRQSGLH